MLDRRMLLGGMSLTAGALLHPRLLAARTNAIDDHVVEVRQGKLRGATSNGVSVFRGVPYAGNVSGAGRFRAAPPPAAWSGVRDATRLGAPAIQPPGGMYGLNEPAPSEDCLVLNIWTPKGGAARKPVMVYSHGGGFVTGSAGSVVQDGTNLAREHDVVVVATNHRLGLLGFLYLDDIAGGDYVGSGNRGIQDIAVALDWIAQNIAAFGGDPDNVTIFGESGGGMKTSCLYAMPQAAPYFGKASIESGPGVRIMMPEQASETTARVLHHLGLKAADWRKLLDVPVTQLLDAQTKIASAPNATPRSWGGRNGLGGGSVGAFGAVLDGHVMPHHPFDPEPPAMCRDKPILVGGNEDEQMFFSLVAGDLAAWNLTEAALNERLSSAFGQDAPAVVAAYRQDRPGASPSDLFFAVQSDLFSGQGSTVIAERKAKQGGAPAFRYIFAFDQGAAVPGTNHRTGAMHALDIAFKFNNMDAAIPGRPPLAGPRPERLQAGASMSGFWVSFARSGKPEAAGQPSWPAYDLRNRSTMYIDSRCHVENDPFRAERQFWEARPG